MTDDSEDYKYSLGTYGDSPSFNLLIEITADEYDEFADAIGAVTRLRTTFDYMLVERNFLDLQSIYQFVAITFSLGSRFARPDHRQLGEALMSSTVNWLTSVRLFLDHTETQLKRRFGKDSTEVERFRLSTSSTFDSNVGYRFCYKFRNYVQHCGLPLSTISLREASKSSKQPAPHSVALLLDRDGLLLDYKEWGPVKADLKAMPAKFALLPLALEAMEGARGVYRELLDIKLSYALRYCDTLERALNRIEATRASETPALYKYRGDFKGETQLTPRLFSAEAVRKLVEVANGSAPRDSILSSEGQRKPRFDPATVRQQFHRDSRGVQVISAWLAEGGASPGFFNIVNGILQEDQGIQPLVTGLVNVSVLLAHMTAGALGATAEGLVAGLLDAYGEFDQESDDE
jgi:hypothetical protein